MFSSISDLHSLNPGKSPSLWQEKKVSRYFQMSPCFCGSVAKSCPNHCNSISFILATHILLLCLILCYPFFHWFSVIQCCLTLCDPWTTACQASLSFTISWSLLKLISIESLMPSNHLILCHPLLLLPSLFSSISIFSNELALCIRKWSHSVMSNSLRPHGQ